MRSWVILGSCHVVRKFALGPRRIADMGRVVEADGARHPMRIRFDPLPLSEPSTTAGPDCHRPAPYA